jgi:trk system potassium uptake protein TrkH
MNLFESVCHAFGTIATGGFSPKNSSIGGYSPYIQYVVMVFMMLSGTNFIIHYYLVKREISKITGNEEFRFFLTVLIVTGGVITALLFFESNRTFEASFRESYFQLISIVTTTGYATADYLLWPQAAWLIIFFAMFLGGSAGSTSGGIKMVRQLILLKGLRANFRQLRYPNAIIPVRLNKKALPNDISSSTLTFIIFYLMLFVIGTLGLNFMGLDGQTASSSVATCMAGIGPGIGTVGPASNFAHLPDLGKIELTFLMVLGRLEMYTVLVLFTKNFWKS